jgi:diguanylate cyclase
MAREGMVCLGGSIAGYGSGTTPRLVTGADDRIAVLVGSPRVEPSHDQEAPFDRTEPLVLVVSGDPGACAALRSGLAQCGFQAASADDVGAAVRILPQLRPDVVLLDAVNGLLEAPTVCSEMRARMRDSTTPMVVLVADPELEAVLDAPGAGVTRFVAKPAGPRALARVLRDSLRRGQAARRPDDFDATTALPNQGLFRRRLARALERAERERRFVAVLSLDVEWAESVADFDGPARAQLLGMVAERLSTCVRASDVVAADPTGLDPGAQPGHERFSLLLDDLDDLETVATVERRISTRLRQPVRLGGREVRVAASFGIASYPRDGAYADRLLETAHRTQSGEPRQRRDDARHDPLADLDRLTLASRLRDAVERDVLVLVYQPQFDAPSGAVIGLEAFVRWHDGERLVPPDEFLPVAEDMGVVVPLGDWVLRTACVQAVAWQRAGLPPVRLSVNVSSRQLHQPGFAASVRQTLDETGLAPEWLQLELTEATLGETDGTVAALTALRELGVHVAIKAGSFSRSQLRLPITDVKIGRSLLSGISSRPDGATIVRAIVELARGLRLGVMAEGVERPEQLELLQREGCSAVQGFLLAGPCATDEVTTLLASTPARHGSGALPEAAAVA